MLGHRRPKNDMWQARLSTIRVRRKVGLTTGCVHMGQKMKSVSLVSIMMLSVLSTLLMATVTVSANTVVVTEAIQVVDGGTAADQQAAVSVPTAKETCTSCGLGTTSTSTTQCSHPAATHSSTPPKSPTPVFTRFGILTWPSTNSTAFTSFGPTKPANTKSSTPSSTRGPPLWTAPQATMVRSVRHRRPRRLDALHRTATGQPSIWTAKETPTLSGKTPMTSFKRFFNQPQIYYSMLQPDPATGAVVTLFDDTLLTPIIGHKGPP